MQEIKSNKGITLIALVVTIIILLILAGVSITTLSGNGLFGRAESSAAKYQAASEAENSTISSLLDKYDNYDRRTTEMITFTWSEPIAREGNFINSLTPAASKESNFQDKEIVAIKPDGTKVLINPYEAGSVTVPRGTTLRFYYYVDKNAYDTSFEFYRIGSTDLTHSGNLKYVDWTEDYWTAEEGNTEKDTYEIYYIIDRIEEWDNGKVYYQWLIDLEPPEK